MRSQSHSFMFTYFPLQNLNKYLGKCWHRNGTSPNTKLVAKVDLRTSYRQEIIQNSNS